MNHQPSLTTVVMTRNRRAELLDTLMRHHGPVVVVDNGSTDGTPDVLDALRRPGLTVVPLRRNRGALARNIGVAHARTPLVAFADDDSWWEPDALARATVHFERCPRLGLLAARLSVRGERVDPVSTAMATAPLGVEDDLPGPNVLGFLACAAVVRRDAFLAAGGFDPVVFFAGEEERLAWDLAAAGWGLAYTDDVTAHHRPSSVRSTPDTRQRRIARNAVLSAIMRRPWPVVTGRIEAARARGGPSAAGVRDAVPRLPLALVRRRRLPPAVEAAAAHLERAGTEAVIPA